MIIEIKESTPVAGVDDTTFAGKLLRSLLRGADPPALIFREGTPPSLKTLVEKCYTMQEDDLEAGREVLDIDGVRSILMGKVRNEVHTQVRNKYNLLAPNRKNVQTKNNAKKTKATTNNNKDDDVKPFVSEKEPNGIAAGSEKKSSSSTVQQHESESVDQLIEEFDNMSNEGSELSL